MSRFNLSAWGIRHSSLVAYFLIALTAIGMLAYKDLGQSEDPPFTFKIMLVRANWPGATAQEVADQVTDKIEKTLQEIPQTDNITSYSKPGEMVILFEVKDSTPAHEMPDIWYQVRKKIGDMAYTLPQGVQGPFFNDEFGDVYGNIFALVGEGLNYAELKRYGEAVRTELLRVPDVAKVDFFGAQDERVFIELSNTKLATFGLALSDVTGALANQNAMIESGFFETGDERIRLRPDGQFNNLEDLRNTLIRAGGRTFRLGDVAKVWRGYEDPPSDRVRFMGRPTLGVGVSMRTGGDIIALGKHLDAAVKRIDQQLPVGVELARVADQPRAVQRSVNEFVKVLTEAVVIVLAVSLLSLGMRTGIVVAITIPVVLAITFLFMREFNIGLHKISLGALILALGLLVDDAIIAVEMMATKMEQGWDRIKAASYAFTSTAKPMLSGTLVTAAGFLPIATAASATGEYTRSIFQVTVIALLVSWVAAVVFVPYLGYYLLPDFTKKRDKPGLLARLVGKLSPKLGERLAAAQPGGGEHHDEYAIYHTKFYTRFRAVVQACVRHRWITIFVTLAVFVGSIVMFGSVPQQFFPDSTRPELVVDLELQEGASHQATEREVRDLEAWLDKQAGIENYVAYVGAGAPRFYLPIDQKLPQVNFAEFVILTDGYDAREALRTKLIDHYRGRADGVMAVVKRLENGPPVGFPVRYRLSGPDIDVLQAEAEKVAAVMRGNNHLTNVHLDWNEPSKVVRLRIDQDKARLLGLSSAQISSFLKTSLHGMQMTEFREGTETIDVLLRGAPAEREHLSLLTDLAIPVVGGKSVPIGQVVTPVYDFEPGVIWRRNRIPTVRVQASLYDGTQPAEVVGQLAARIDEVASNLPLGYRLEVGGAVEKSAQGGASVAAGMPLFIIVVLTVLMIQLQSFSRMIMVVLTAPLGIIGVAAALLLFNKPFGFVAMLGTIALSGMIMRNSVILVDQIRQDLEDGFTPWEAVVESTVRRFRPIMLTAAAAILAMIPLSRSVFFGPMAVAIMGGLAVATVLTLIFLPALYAAWYRVKPDETSGQGRAAAHQVS